MALQSAEFPPWSDLPPELLGRIVTCCRKPVDRASFRAVCRSWRFAVRHHCPRTPLTPWALHLDGSFFTLPDGHHRKLPTTVIRRYEPAYGFYNNPSRFSRARHRLPLPEHTRCIGSSNGWLALLRLRHGPNSTEHGTFLLHDPFSNTTVPLPEVNAISAKAPFPDAFDVFKVLMRSTIDDIIAVAVMTLSRHYSFILSLPGKSAWTPEPKAPPFAYIVDIAFLGDKLYGITKAEDLFSFDLSLHDQVPAIRSCERVIRHPLPLHSYGYGIDYLQWSDVDEEETDKDDIEEDDIDESDVDEEETTEDDIEEDEIDEGDVDEERDAFDEDEGAEEEVSLDSVYAPDDSYGYDSVHEEFDWDDEEVPVKIECGFDKDLSGNWITTIRYLVESRGKLIMVKQHLRTRHYEQSYTRNVKIFEADTNVGAWVPVGDGGLDGSAIFVSQRFSKSVSASVYGEGRLEEDAIYFVDTGEVFHVRSATVTPALWRLRFDESTWVFPPDLN